jgi:hypothetical protein
MRWTEKDGCNTGALWKSGGSVSEIYDGYNFLANFVELTTMGGSLHFSFKNQGQHHFKKLEFRT